MSEPRRKIRAALSLRRRERATQIQGLKKEKQFMPQTTMLRKKLESSAIEKEMKRVNQTIDRMADDLIANPEECNRLLVLVDDMRRKLRGCSDAKDGLDSLEQDTCIAESPNGTGQRLLGTCVGPLAYLWQTIDESIEVQAIQPPGRHAPKWLSEFYKVINGLEEELRRGAICQERTMSSTESIAWKAIANIVRVHSGGLVRLLKSTPSNWRDG
jgi:hypothetical protein